MHMTRGIVSDNGERILSRSTGSYFDAFLVAAVFSFERQIGMIRK